MVIFSCSEDDANSFFDCLGESSVTHIRHEPNSENSLRVELEIEYNGEYSVSRVNWKYGDGNEGTGLTTNHTYSSPGTYKVEATVAINEGGSNCSFTKERSISVE
ncbi:PKD domain-containing protein [Gramella lutea]|uniref:PKD domain-containing protein n=1 Tax=Christiangramia lutea TaxID=1607951 RepID=A0A9X2AA70_9FLAO|nr:PKD domain-containing protein [Christiangramia lutea]MCH4824409.1 PKD domain-containing protein [Christiangramia lutea]